jgi:hypothetical protein
MIRCTVTADFVYANHRTGWSIFCTEAIFKENKQQRSWWQKQYSKNICI